MLPKLLCEKLCSLNPNEEKLTYSIFFRIDLSSGKIDKSFEPII
jgi:exoribonuclease R